MYRYVKRAIDIVAAAVLLLLTAPLSLLIALAIKLDSRGPVLYRGERVGRGGRRFRMNKFRTMRADDGSGPSSTADDDPRITRVGRRLRRSKLDELPQLLNVLLGDMSLVGPRPQVPWAVARYTPAEREVLQVRPGITDFASLEFRHEGELLRGSADPDRTYLELIHPRKMQLARAYVEQMSLRVDLQILLSTLAVLAGRNR
jgi:lipopolysaccharide/colanic/teichoic acid biosynthesis glycosyltransferase